MIFVTVGMHYESFERLIKKMDEIAGKIDEEVIMQVGSIKYRPKNAKYFNFVDDDEIMEYFKQARVIISHAGAGTLLNVLALKKPVIVVPRLKKFGEHIDDQQLDLARVLSKEGKVIVVHDIEELEEALKRVEKLRFTNLVKKDEKLINFLKEYIGSLE